jgi:hypothetical protein
MRFSFSWGEEGEGEGEGKGLNCNGEASQVRQGVSHNVCSF